MTDHERFFELATDAMTAGQVEKAATAARSAAKEKRRELIEIVVAHAISIGTATKESRKDDREKCIAEVRRILQEALAD